MTHPSIIACKPSLSKRICGTHFSQCHHLCISQSDTAATKKQNTSRMSGYEKQPLLSHPHVVQRHLDESPRLLHPDFDEKQAQRETSPAVRGDRGACRNGIPRETRYIKYARKWRARSLRSPYLFRYRADMQYSNRYVRGVHMPACWR